MGNLTFMASVTTRDGEAIGEGSLELEVPASYSKHIQPIWDLNCGGCHEGPDANKGLRIVAPGQPAATTWRDIVNVFAAEPDLESTAQLLVRPFLPEFSYLFHKLRGTHLTRDVAGSGERMPLGAPPYLTATEEHRVKSWILQGARND